MSERKVLNKYYPPDFDVTKLPKLKLKKERQFVIRIMAPFSMRCKTCGDYIYKGRKFNSRMETIKDETYLGLRKYRFYIKCPKCLSEITFKTDPEKTDYEMEHGATRNFQAHKFAAEEESRAKAEKEEEELNNPMKALENRTKESQLEMSRLEDLEDIKEINKRYAVIDHESLLKRHIALEDEIRAQQEAEDEEMIRKTFGKPEGEYFKRISDSDDDEEASLPSIPDSRKREATDILTMEDPEKKESKKKPSNSTFSSRHSLTNSLAGLKQGIITKKARKENLKESVSSTSSSETAPKSTVTNSNQSFGSSREESGSSTALGLLGDYDSNNSSSSED